MIYNYFTGEAIISLNDESTWLVLYDPKDWNVNAHTKDEILCRSNNALERFNRKMNQAFPTAHPSMCQFVDTIKAISNDYIYTLDRIAKRTMPPPHHEPATMYPIPSDYKSFKC